MTRPKMIARPAHNSRNGQHLSLRVVNDATGHSIEFARLRMERSGWNLWAADKDEQITLSAHAFRAGRKASLATVLAGVRAGYAEWNGLDEPVEHDGPSDLASWDAEAQADLELHNQLHPYGYAFDATGPGQDWDCNGTQH